VTAETSFVPEWLPLSFRCDEDRELAWDAVRGIAGSVLNAHHGNSEGLIGVFTPEVALLCGYLAISTGEEHWLDNLAAVMGGVNGRSSQQGAGLYGGVLGVGWIAAHLTRLIADEGPECELTDAPIGQAGSADFDHALLHHLEQDPWSGHYNLRDGLVGIGAYFLERLPAKIAVSGIRTVVERLESAASPLDDGIAWFTRPEFQPDWQRSHCPDGCYDLGVLRGVPGVIHFLNQVIMLGLGDHKTERLLSGAIDWMLAQRLPEGSSSQFPMWVTPDESPEARLAWCYGDLGILAVLSQVDRRCGGGAMPECTHQLLDWCLAWPLDESGISDAALCHGSAGVAHIFQRLYQITRDPRCLEAAETWFRQTLWIREPGQGIAGFSNITATDQPGFLAPIANPTFLDGAIGTALALLAGLSGIEPAWDRLLLLSRRHCSLPAEQPSNLQEDERGQATARCLSPRCESVTASRCEKSTG
jgi:hypothetical protein